jgi:hypothetical protein
MARERRKSVLKPHIAKGVPAAQINHNALLLNEIFYLYLQRQT